MDLTTAELLASKWDPHDWRIHQFVSLGLLQGRGRLRGGTKLSPSIFSLLLLFDVWPLSGHLGPNAWPLPNKPGPHFATFLSFVSTRRNYSADYSFNANSGHNANICSGVPSKADFIKSEVRWAEDWGLPSSPQVIAFVPGVQLSHCSLFCVCLVTLYL